MTNPPPDETPAPESEHRPTFREWLGQKGITESGEPLPETDSGNTPDESPPLFAPDVRAICWTIPLGVLWEVGAYVVAHISGHDGAFVRLTGLGLVALAVNLACEVSLAYTLKDDYPRLGVWEWLLNPRPSTVVDRAQKAVNAALGSGCLLTLFAGLMVPALVVAFYLFFAALSAAVPIWVAFVVITSVIHIASTLIRHNHRKTNDTTA
jgi:hypothetical protein